MKKSRVNIPYKVRTILVPVLRVPLVFANFTQLSAAASIADSRPHSCHIYYRMPI